MEITINTDAKTVQVSGTTNLKELYKELKKLLGDEFDKYELINYATWIYPSYPVYPSYPFGPTFTDKLDFVGTCNMEISNLHTIYQFN